MISALDFRAAAFERCILDHPAPGFDKTISWIILVLSREHDGIPSPINGFGGSRDLARAYYSWMGYWIRRWSLLLALIVGALAAFVGYRRQRREGGGHRGSDLVWLAWLMPLPAVWDAVHRYSGSDLAAGGAYPGQIDYSGQLDFDLGRDSDPASKEYALVASYCTPVEVYIRRRHPKYRSLLDLGTGAGMLLSRMCYLNRRCSVAADDATADTTATPATTPSTPCTAATPATPAAPAPTAPTAPCARHYGLDIAPSMVTAAWAKCQECTSIGTFDMSQLQDEPFDPPSAAFPEAFDIVVVSDVLYYLRWGLFFSPGIISAFRLPPSMFRRAHQTLWDNLRRMATIEVVISDHQRNPSVGEFLKAMGATERNATEGVSGSRIWVVSGTADSA